MGALPLALAGDIYFLRPPKPTSWDKTLYLGSWIIPKSVTPSFQQYLLYPVPVTKNDKWVPMPLETTAEAADREREETTGSEGVRQPNSLAAARAERHQKGLFQDLTGVDSPSDVSQDGHIRHPKVHRQTGTQLLEPRSPVPC
jgi:hypothetical protein